MKKPAFFFFFFWPKWFNLTPFSVRLKDALIILVEEKWHLVHSGNLMHCSLMLQHREWGLQTAESVASYIEPVCKYMPN